MAHIGRTERGAYLNKLSREDFDGGPVNLDEIEPGLWLGNVTAAMDVKGLERLNITHILTVDSVPLPCYVSDLPKLNVRYVQAADMPKEDLLSSFPDCIQYIKDCLDSGKRILVHCYFGVSRSATIVIAFIMEKYKLSYERAFQRVKAKRRFVGPNPGFVVQLKLFAKMNFTLDRNSEKFKLYRLKIAADKFKKVKILSISQADLVKSDPALIRELPEPVVYRCRKCRRVVASKSNLITHKPKKNNLTSPVKENAVDTSIVQPPSYSEPSTSDQINYLTEGMRRNSLGSDHSRSSDKQDTTICTKTYFIEPLAWMTDIYNKPEGRLYCPKCVSKLGSFNWIMATKCPCGAEIQPAFYLLPSRVEYSNVVQNVQITV